MPIEVQDMVGTISHRFDQGFEGGRLQEINNHRALLVQPTQAVQQSAALFQRVDDMLPNGLGQHEQHAQREFLQRLGRWEGPLRVTTESDRAISHQEPPTVVE